jgi:uncharacterized protein YcbK (DUF882 family)
MIRDCKLSHEIGRFSRRRFLRGFSALALAPLAAMSEVPPPDRRSLSFVHTHTGEALTTTYFQNDNYLAPSLERINHLLRDFRTDEVHSIDPAVLDILFDLQAKAKHEGPFEVISGYRSPQTNAALRRQSSAVAEHSLHMEGRAIDVRLRGFPTVRLRDIAIALHRGGVGFYAASDFVHVDNGRVRAW